MQWNSGPNAGFTPKGTAPWLPVADDYETVNVEVCLEDPESTLNMYRRLLDVRRASDALRFGSFMVHPSSSDDVFVYRRESDHQTVSIALNFSAGTHTVPLRSGEIIFSTADPERAERFRDELLLQPGEGVIVRHR